MESTSANTLRELELALTAAAGSDVALERPTDPDHGDYATNVALRLAGVRKQPPRAIAEALVEHALGLRVVERAEVAGPGFVNLWLESSWYADTLAGILAAGEEYGGGSADSPERIQVEMVSANPTGPIVVSAARNGAYGDCVARLLAFAGHEVERAEVAGPGFVNLWLDRAWYGDALAEVLEAGAGFGGGQAEQPERQDDQS